MTLIRPTMEAMKRNAKEQAKATVNPATHFEINEKKEFISYLTDALIEEGVMITELAPVNDTQYAERYWMITKTNGYVAYNMKENKVEWFYELEEMKQFFEGIVLGIPRCGFIKRKDFSLTLTIKTTEA